MLFSHIYIYIFFFSCNEVTFLWHENNMIMWDFHTMIAAWGPFSILAGLESTHWEPDGQPKATICRDRLSARTVVRLQTVMCGRSSSVCGAAWEFNDNFNKHYPCTSNTWSQPRGLLNLRTGCYTVYCVEMRCLSTWLDFWSTLLSSFYQKTISSHH